MFAVGVNSEIEGHTTQQRTKNTLVNSPSWSGDKSADLNVKKMTIGETTPILLKSWDMHADDPEHTFWTLTIPMNLEVDGDVRVEDEVQGGHKLVDRQRRNNRNETWHYGGDTAIEDFKAAFLDQHLQWMLLKNHDYDSKRPNHWRSSIVQK